MNNKILISLLGRVILFYYNIFIFHNLSFEVEILIHKII